LINVEDVQGRGLSIGEEVMLLLLMMMMRMGFVVVEMVSPS